MWRFGMQLKGKQFSLTKRKLLEDSFAYQLQQDLTLKTNLTQLAS